MTRALVTGANGFLGRLLCAELQRRDVTVRALLRSENEGPWDETAIAELGAGPLDESALAGVDAVYHLAAYTHALADSPDEAVNYQRINVNGTRFLVEAAEKADVRALVFTSSVKAAGEGGPARVDETTPDRPTTPYGLSKREAEGIIRESALPHVAILRLPMVYGTIAKGNLPRMINAIRRGRFPPLPETGNRRSLVHADDVVAALLLAADVAAADREMFYLTDGEAYSTRRMTDAIHNALGTTPPGWSIPVWILKLLGLTGDLIGTLRGRRFLFDSDALEKLTGSAWYGSEKAQRILGYTPGKTLPAALPEIAAFLSKPAT